VRLEDEIKSSFRNEYHKALVNLYYTNSLIGQKFFKLINKHGLATPQFNVLRILKGQYPKAATIGLIKDRMVDKNSDASRIVDRLHKKELVNRTESQIDRRQKEVIITQKGLDLLEKMSFCEEEEDAILSNLNKQEVQHLNMLLDKIRS